MLFFDEIDALRGQSLRSVLSQLRAHFDERPDTAPWSVVLCGLRDVRDYKLAAGGGEPRAGSSSPFNIKPKSVRLGDFTEAEVRLLCGQHTAATGQPFADAALARIFELSRGQPWLVNALAREVLEELRVTGTVDADHVEQAKERLILARATHLDSLVARLHEPRVRSVLEPLLGGQPMPPLDAYFHRVLTEFAAFWREHGDILATGLSYHEVAPQLVLMAFLQRVVNGDCLIDREYGVGRGRIDLHVRWPYVGTDGRQACQREALELKVRDRGGDPLNDGLVQLDAYLTRLALEHGTLVIFDRRAGAPPLEERVTLETVRTPLGREVTLLRA